MRVLVADDEPLARKLLRTLLARRDDVELVAECGSGETAIAEILRHRPDCVFLDIRMPGKDGFEVIDSIGSAPMPRVVFVTAHDDYAVRAFDVHAADYLLKPFDQERFDAAVDRVVASWRAADDARLAERLSALIAELRPATDATARRSRIAVRENGRITFIAAEEIDWIEAASDYTRIHAGKRAPLVRSTMSELEARLDPRCFVRIHRSIIVNVGQIRELQPHFNGEYFVVLRDGTTLKSSRTFRDRLRQVFGDDI
jgi:two-component system LytT family response regulator